MNVVNVKMIFDAKGVVYDQTQTVRVCCCTEKVHGVFVNDDYITRLRKEGLSVDNHGNRAVKDTKQFYVFMPVVCRCAVLWVVVIVKNKRQNRIVCTMFFKFVHTKPLNVRIVQFFYF